MLARGTSRTMRRPIPWPPAWLLASALLVALSALLASQQPRLTAWLVTQPEPLRPTVIAQTSTHLVALDARSGEVIADHPGGAAVLAASPTGERVLALTEEEATVYRFPGWTVEHTVALGPSMPPAQSLPALREAWPRPVVAQVSADSRYAAVSLVSMGTPPAYPWILWVTTLDLERGTWASWAFPVPGAQYTYLVAGSEHLFVVARDNAVSRLDTVGSVYQLDPASGTLLQKRELRSTDPGFAPFPDGPGGRVPSVAGVRLSGRTLDVVTERLELFRFDAATLQLIEQRPPLSAAILTWQVAWLGPDRLAVLTHTDALAIADLAERTLTTRLSLEGLAGEQLAGADPATDSVLLLAYDERSLQAAACLFRLTLTGERTTLACGLDLNLYERRFAPTGGLS